MATTEPTSPSVKSKPPSVKPSKTGIAAQKPSPPEPEPAPPPPPKPPSTRGGFKKFLYNKEEGSCLGRTGLSWLKIMIFYIVFYYALGAFFVALLFITIFNFPEDKPFASIDTTLNSVPGLGFRPVTIDGSALIYFDKANSSTYKKFVDNLNKITQADTTTKSKYYDCPAKAIDKIKQEKEMKKNITCRTYTGFDWGPCNVKDKFGYSEGKPCVLIRLNKIIDWKPKGLGVNQSTLGYKNMPYAIHLNSTVVCISCKGDSVYAEQHIGRIEYYPTDDKRPGPCINSVYFPYLNQKDGAPYLAPYIFAYFPELPEKIHLQVVCQAYNKAIPKDTDSTKKGFGVARFELLVGKVTDKDFPKY